MADDATDDHHGGPQPPAALPEEPEPPHEPDDAAPPGGPAGAPPAVAGDLRPGAWKAPFQGVFMGLADAVPGVSGGTIAFLLGIHRRLVGAIASVDAALVKDIFGKQGDARQAWRRADLGFLVLLGIGIASGLLVGATFLADVLERWPDVLMALILGLVVASIRAPARWVQWDVRTGLVAAGVAVPAFILTVLEPIHAPTAAWFLPVAGAIAVCAMILPGISGAYLLLIMGLYEPIIHAVAELEMATIALVGMGAVIGILAFSKGLRWLLDEHTSLTHAAMVGLLVGSLGRLWPWRTAAGFGEGDPATPSGLGLWVFIALGLVLGALLDRLPRTKDR